MARGTFSHVLEARNHIKGPNTDGRRLAMYAFYASRGLAIPFELADNEEELAKYAQLDIDSLPSPPDARGGIDSDLMETLEDA